MRWAEAIRAVREGLRMSAQQLGQRLGVKRPTIVALEQSEVKGTIVGLRTVMTRSATFDFDEIGECGATVPGASR
jgi:transcriptional regulator with XRE-family HTH domain